MKKIIIAAVVAVLVLVAYLAQVAYMGSLNEKIYSFITTYKNDIVSIEITDFQKGFFNHKAKVNLYVKIPDDDMVRGMGMGLSQTPIPAEIHLKNNIFAKDNIIIDIENPFYEIMKGALASSEGQMSFEKVFLRLKIALSLSQKIAIKTEFTDIDIDKEGFVLKLQKLNGILLTDANGSLYDAALNLDKFDFKVNVWGSTLSFFIGKTIFDSKFEAGVKFDDYLNNLAAAQSKGSIEKISFDDLTITGIKYDENSSVENELVNSVADISIQAITSDLKGIFLDNIRSHIEIGNFSPTLLNALEHYNPYLMDDESFLMELFATNPVIELSDLSFNSKGKEFNSQGALRGSLNDYRINFSAQSQAAPSEILPPFSFIGIDEFFVQKDGKYVADFLLESDYKSTKMLLNGKDISKEEAVVID